MEKKTLFEILKKNGVKFNTAILEEEVDGYASDENEAYSQTLYKDLFLLSQYGMQKGFKSVGKKISQLTDFIAKLLNGTKYKSVNLAKMETARAKIMRRSGRYKEGINMDMKDVLLENLDDCIRVADAIVGFRGDNQALCSRITESKEVLLQIRTELEGVTDVLSKKAGSYQVKVFNILLEWRKSISRYQCYSDSIESLRTALSSVKEWSKLTKSVKLFDRSKAGTEHYDHYNTKVDDVYGIIQGSAYAERTDGLKNAVASYREHTEKMNDTDAITREKQELEAQKKSELERINGNISAIEAEIKEAIIALQNGELDEDTAYIRCADLEAEIANYKEELKEVNHDFETRINELNADRRYAGSDLRIRKKLADEFDKVIKMLESYRNDDPAKFTLFCSRIDFLAMQDMLSGRATEEDINNIFANVKAISRAVETEIIKQREVASQFASIRSDVKNVTGVRTGVGVRTGSRVTTGQTNTNTSASDEAEKKRKLAEMAKKYGVAVSAAPTENQPNENETRTAIDDIIPIGNDDL